MEDQSTACPAAGFLTFGDILKQQSPHSGYLYGRSNWVRRNCGNQGLNVASKGDGEVVVWVEVAVLLWPGQAWLDGLPGLDLDRLLLESIDQVCK